MAVAGVGRGSGDGLCRGGGRRSARAMAREPAPSTSEGTPLMPISSLAHFHTLMAFIFRTGNSNKNHCGNWQLFVFCYQLSLYYLI